MDGRLGDTGVEHGALIAAFADAVVGDDDARLAKARSGVFNALGADALVDAAAVAGFYNAIVRVASDTGIPLDEEDAESERAFIESLGIDRLEHRD